MKHLKLILALLISMSVIFSCKPKENKPGTTPDKPVAGKLMSYDELAKAIGNANALAVFDKAGLTEAPSGDAAARGAKKPKPNAQLTVIEDLVLTQISGDEFTSTTSDNAHWFSYQVFVPGATPDPNEGAYATCNHYYSTVGGAPDNENCTITTSGNVRTFTSDFNYVVHLSNVVFKP